MNVPNPLIPRRNVLVGMAALAAIGAIPEADLLADVDPIEPMIVIESRYQEIVTKLLSYDLMMSIGWGNFNKVNLKPFAGFAAGTLQIRGWNINHVGEDFVPNQPRSFTFWHHPNGADAYVGPGRIYRRPDFERVDFAQYFKPEWLEGAYVRSETRRMMVRNPKYRPNDDAAITIWGRQISPDTRKIFP